MDLIKAFRAWRIGKLLFKRATRGRIFEKKHEKPTKTDDNSEGAMASKAKAEGSLVKVKITRANGKVEEIYYG